MEKLKEGLLEKEENGKLAELFVFNFERNRLGNLLGKRVAIISKINVSAGYDIISYNDSNSINYDRFIEVKSFKDKPHFYWSKNEREKACQYKEKYYLYLVDLSQINNPKYCPIIIQNPYYNLSDDLWSYEPISWYYEVRKN